MERSEQRATEDKTSVRKEDMSSVAEGNVILENQITFQETLECVIGVVHGGPWTFPVHGGSVWSASGRMGWLGGALNQEVHLLL